MEEPDCNGEKENEKDVCLCNGDDDQHSEGSAEHRDCMAQISKLMRENNELRLRATAFCEHFDMLNMKNMSQNLANGDIIVDNDESSISPRSDRSISTHVSAAALQVSLDIFAENNRLLQDKEMHERRRDQELLNLYLQLEETKKQLKSCEDRCSSLNDALDNRQRETSTKMNGLENELKNKNLQLETLSGEREALNRQYNDLLKQKSIWQTKIDELKSILRNQQTTEKNFDQLKSENDKLKSQLKVYTDQFQELSCQLATCKSNLQIKIEEVDHYQQLLDTKSKENFKTEYELSKMRLNEITVINKELSQEINELKTKVSASGELQRAFDSQNLGLNGLKDVLKIKDATISEITARNKELEQQLNEMRREKDQKCASIVKIQEELNKKSDELEKVNKESEDWKANAINQYEDTNNKYEEKIKLLHTILQKYTDYPGKEDFTEKMEKWQQELDKIKDDLKNSVEQSEQYKNELETLKIDKKNLLAKIEEKEDCMKKLERCQKELDRNKLELKDFIEMSEEYKNEIEMLKITKQNLMAKIKKKEDCIKKLEQCLKELDKNKAELRNSIEIIEKYETEIENLKINEQNLMAKIESKENCDENLEKCQQELDKTKIELKNSIDLSEKYKNELEMLRIGSQNLLAKIEVIEDCMEKLERCQKELDKNKTELKNSIELSEEYKNELETLTTDKQNFLVRIDQLNKHVLLSESLHVQASKTIEMLREQHLGDAARINAYGAKINRLNSEIERLKRKNVSLSNEAQVLAAFSKTVVERALPGFQPLAPAESGSSLKDGQIFDATER